MKSPKPLLDAILDQQNPADGQRFLRLIEELKVKVAADSVSHGILLHKWVDSTHIRVVVFEGTPAGKEAAEAMLGEGFDEGPFFGVPSDPGLSDVVAKVRSATAHLHLPEGHELPGGQASAGPAAHGPASSGPASTGPVAPGGPTASVGPRSAPRAPQGRGGPASSGPQGTGRIAGTPNNPPQGAAHEVPAPGQTRTAPLPPRQAPASTPSAPLRYTGPQPPTGPLPRGGAKPKKPPHGK